MNARFLALATLLPLLFCHVTAEAQDTETVIAQVDVSGPIGPALTRNVTLPPFDTENGTRVLTGVQLLPSTLTALSDFEVEYTGPFPSNETIRVDAVTDYNIVFPGSIQLAQDRDISGDAGFSADGPITFDGAIDATDTIPITSFSNTADYEGSNPLIMSTNFDSRLSFTVITGIRSRWMVRDGDVRITGNLRFRYTFSRVPCNPVDIADPIGTINQDDILQLVSLIEQDDPQADLNGDGNVDFFDCLTGLTFADEGCP